MRIVFHGGIEDVTGSMTLINLPEGKVLVDCGLHQGLAESQNYNPLAFEASDIKAVLLTHAHLDHCGYLPKLFQLGFRGNVYCTKASQKLARIILQDSADIMEQNRGASILYTKQDCEKVLSLFKSVEQNQWIELLGARICFRFAGHILGASSIEIRTDKCVVFSGDLGRAHDPMMAYPLICPPCEFLVMESTYGGKNRSGDMEKDLYSFLVQISREKKVGIIASFAVARAQLLFSLIHQFFIRHPEEKFRIVADSPMMEEANEIYSQLLPQQFSFLKEVEFIRNQSEWESLRKKKGPLLIISSSGMLAGGRIWRAVKNWCDDPEAILFFPGYQSLGTPGRRMIEGEKHLQSPDGEMLEWKGSVIHSEAFSSHADQSELLSWVKDVPKDSRIYLVHGEEESKKQLLQKLNEQGYKNVHIPNKGEGVEI